MTNKQHPIEQQPVPRVPAGASSFRALYLDGANPAAYAAAANFPVGRLYNWTKRPYPLACRVPCSLCSSLGAWVRGQALCAHCVNVIGEIVRVLESHSYPGCEPGSEEGLAWLLVGEAVTRRFHPPDPAQLDLPLDGEIVG